MFCMVTEGAFSLLCRVPHKGYLLLHGMVTEATSVMMHWLLYVPFYHII